MNQAAVASKPFYPRAWLYTLLAMSIVVAGFIPSFFGRLGETDLWHHIHGMSATAWLTLLVVQPLLYSRGQLALHRKLGKLAYFILPLLIVGGVQMINLMIDGKDHYPPQEVYRLSLLDTISMAYLVFAFVQGIRYARITGLHARYMASSVMLIIIPGLARLLFNILPGVITGFTINLHICFLLIEFATLLLLIDDKRRDGVLSKPYIQMTAVVVLSHLSILFSPHWQWWQNLMLNLFS